MDSSFLADESWMLLDRGEEWPLSKFHTCRVPVLPSRPMLILQVDVRAIPGGYGTLCGGSATTTACLE